MYSRLFVKKLLFFFNILPLYLIKIIPYKSKHEIGVLHHNSWLTVYIPRNQILLGRSHYFLHLTRPKPFANDPNINQRLLPNEERTPGNRKDEENVDDICEGQWSNMKLIIKEDQASNIAG